MPSWINRQALGLGRRRFGGRCEVGLHFGPNGSILSVVHSLPWIVWGEMWVRNSSTEEGKTRKMFGSVQLAAPGPHEPSYTARHRHRRVETSKDKYATTICNEGEEFRILNAIKEKHATCRLPSRPNHTIWVCFHWHRRARWQGGLISLREAAAEAMPPNTTILHALPREDGMGLLTAHGLLLAGRPEVLHCVNLSEQGCSINVSRYVYRW